MSQKVLLNAKEVQIALHRLACQLIENHDTFSNTVLIGIQPRGIYLAERLKTMLENDYNIKKVLLGYLDITFTEMTSEEVTSLWKLIKRISILSLKIKKWYLWTMCCSQEEVFARH